MRRPFSLTLLAWTAIGLALFNLLGAYASLSNYAYLSQLSLDVPLAYLIVGQAFWAVAWGWLAAGIWRRSGWARGATLAGSAVYLAHGWVNRLVWGRSDYLVVTWPWAAVAGGLGVAVAWWMVLRYRYWGAVKGDKAAQPD